MVGPNYKANGSLISGVGESVDDVMPGRDGPDNLKILKKSELKVDIEPCRQKVEYLPLSWKLRVEFWP